MKEMLWYVWNAGGREYCGIYRSDNSRIKDSNYLSQAFEIEVPDCPVVLTDAEKLEKLLKLGKVYFDGVADNECSWSGDKEHHDELMDLLKEYLEKGKI